MLPLLSLEVNQSKNVSIRHCRDYKHANCYFSSQGKAASVPGEGAGLFRDGLTLWYTPARKLGNINTLLVLSLKYLVQELWLFKNIGMFSSHKDT